MIETGRCADEARFPAVSKKTSPGRWRRAAATSTGVMPSSRAGRAGIRVVISTIEAIGKACERTEASWKTPDW
jgi:hypothetical protein